jgi:two-component system response regulator YesN
MNDYDATQILRVLIVDDERYIVEWIASLLENTIDENIDICVAGSALEALNWLNRSKIDLLITDIKMPIMSGLELLETVKKNWPQCKTILLSAHADFSYARQAIGMNVLGYILKTENDDVITERVREALATIRKEYAEIQIINEAARNIRDSIGLLQEEFLMSLLRGSVYPKDKLLDTIHKLGIDINCSNPVLVAMARIRPAESKFNDQARHDACVEGIVGLTRRFLSYCARFYLIRWDDQTLVWLLQDRRELPEEQLAQAENSSFLTLVKGHLENVQSAGSKNLDYTTALFICADDQYLQNIADKFNRLLRFVRWYNPDESGFIYSFHLDEAEQEAQAAHVPDSDLNELIAAIDSFRQLMLIADAEQARRFFAEHIDKLQVLIRAGYLFYRGYVMLVLLLLEYRRIHQIQGSIDEAQTFVKYLSMDVLADPQQALQTIRQLLDQTIASEDTTNTDNNILLQRTIKLIKDFVVENLDGDISLTAISERTGYNSSYISRLFRQHEHQSYMQYVNQKRLDLIRRYILETDLSLDEIAAAAGLHSRTYFNRFINKMTGKAPGEYKLHLTGK